MPGVQPGQDDTHYASPASANKPEDRWKAYDLKPPTEPAPALANCADWC